MNTAFTIITTLLGQALEALGIDKEQITGTFTLELDQWLCHITFARGYVVLWDYWQDGNWEVLSFSQIPADMEGFFQHTLYFNNIFVANETLPTLLSQLATLGIEPLGYEVHEEDGPCIEINTASPLDMEAQTTLRQLPARNQTFDSTFFTSYEQYQQWRNSPNQEHATEIKRADGSTLIFVDEQECEPIDLNCTCGNCDICVAKRPENFDGYAPLRIGDDWIA